MGPLTNYSLNSFHLNCFISVSLTLQIHYAKAKEIRRMSSFVHKIIVQVYYSRELYKRKSKKYQNIVASKSTNIALTIAICSVEFHSPKTAAKTSTWYQRSVRGNETRMSFGMEFCPRQGYHFQTFRLFPKFSPRKTQNVMISLLYNRVFPGTFCQW